MTLAGRMVVFFEKFFKKTLEKMKKGIKAIDNPRQKDIVFPINSIFLNIYTENSYTKTSPY